MTNFLIELIQERLNRWNRNWMAVFTGETGSGKSYSAMKVAELVDPTFDIDRIVFDVESFVSLLNSGKLKRGNAIMFDEGGIGISSREWFSVSNKAVNFIVQSFRHMNLAVLFTVPSFDYIDSQVRKLFHSYFETQFINHKEGFVEMKMLDIQVSPRSGRVYMKYPVFRQPNGLKTILRRVKIYSPSKQLIDAYETKRIQFTSQLKKEMGEDVHMAKVQREKQVIDMMVVETDLRKNIKSFTKEWQGRKYIDAGLIRAKYGIGENRTTALKRKLEDEFNLR